MTVGEVTPAGCPGSGWPPTGCDGTRRCSTCTVVATSAARRSATASWRPAWPARPGCGPWPSTTAWPPSTRSPPPWTTPSPPTAGCSTTSGCRAARCPAGDSAGAVWSRPCWWRPATAPGPARRGRPPLALGRPHRVRFRPWLPRPASTRSCAAAVLDEMAAAYAGRVDRADPPGAPRCSPTWPACRPWRSTSGPRSSCWTTASALSEAAAAAGVDVTLTVADGMPHVWHIIAAAPEATSPRPPRHVPGRPPA